VVQSCCFVKVIADFLFYFVHAPDMAGGLRVLVQIKYILRTLAHKLIKNVLLLLKTFLSSQSFKERLGLINCELKI
jgi:hypothetical protein